MNSLGYLHLQLRLEGKQVVDGALLRQVEVVPGEEMPLLVLAQLADGQMVAYYDESLPPGLQGELAERTQEVRFPQIEPLLDLFQAQHSPLEVGQYRTYIFPASFASWTDESVKCLSRDEPLVRDAGFGDFSENVYGIERERRLASACVSVRENEQCGEAWVYTDPRHRRQGLARKVVCAWARDLLKAGKVAFYSHKLENLASGHLAKRLGLQSVFEEMVVSR